MNHFFALELSPEVRREVAAFAERWRALCGPRRQARWYAPEDYHLTLKFLGDIPESRQPELIAAAAPVAAQIQPMTIALATSGAFPNLLRPNVLWVGGPATDELRALAQAVDAAMTPLGFAPERRAYKPHVTVARCQLSRQRTGDVWPTLGEHPFPAFEAARFVLMQTLPPEKRPNGSPVRYNPVHTFPFGDAPSSPQS